MGIEQEWRNAQCEDGYPEVDDPWYPYRQRHIQQEDQSPHPEVYAGSGEPRVKNTKGNPSCCETTTSGNVPGTTKGQVAKNGVGVDLGGENLKEQRSRQELFAQSDESTPSTSLSEFCAGISGGRSTREGIPRTLKKEGQERNTEH